MQGRGGLRRKTSRHAMPEREIAEGAERNSSNGRYRSLRIPRAHGASMQSQPIVLRKLQKLQQRTKCQFSSPCEGAHLKTSAPSLAKTSLVAKWWPHRLVGSQQCYKTKTEKKNTKSTHRERRPRNGRAYSGGRNMNKFFQNFHRRFLQQRDTECETLITLVMELGFLCFSSLTEQGVGFRKTMTRM